MTRLTLPAIRLALAVVLLSPVVALAQQSKVEQELLQIERDWCTGDIKRDPAVLTRILSDDATLIGRTGQLRGKKETLAEIKNNTTTACDLDQMKVRVYGDAAVVTGRTSIKAKENYQVMWTDTFVRKDGRWQCVATQSTEIKEAKK